MVPRADSREEDAPVINNGPRLSVVEQGGEAVRIGIDSRNRGRDLDGSGHGHAGDVERRPRGVPCGTTRGDVYRAWVSPGDRAVRRRPGESEAVVSPSQPLDEDGPVQGKRPQLPAIHEDRVAVGIEVDSRGRRRDQDAARHRDARHLERGARGVARDPTRDDMDGAGVVTRDRAIRLGVRECDGVVSCAEALDGRETVVEDGPWGSTIYLNAVTGRIEIDSRRRGRDLDVAGHRDARHLESRAYRVTLDPTDRHGQRARIVPGDAAVARRPREGDTVVSPSEALEPRGPVYPERLRGSAVQLDRVAVRIEVDSHRRGRDLDVPGCRDACHPEDDRRDLAGGDRDCARVRRGDGAVRRNAAQVDRVAAGGQTGDGHHAVYADTLRRRIVHGHGKAVRIDVRSRRGSRDLKSCGDAADHERDVNRPAAPHGHRPGVLGGDRAVGS